MRRLARVVVFTSIEDLSRCHCGTVVVRVEIIPLDSQAVATSGKDLRIRSRSVWSNKKAGNLPVSLVGVSNILPSSSLILLYRGVLEERKSGHYWP